MSIGKLNLARAGGGGKFTLGGGDNLDKGGGRTLLRRRTLLRGKELNLRCEYSIYVGEWWWGLSVREKFLCSFLQHQTLIQYYNIKTGETLHNKAMQLHIFKVLQLN